MARTAIQVHAINLIELGACWVNCQVGTVLLLLLLEGIHIHVENSSKTSMLLNHPLFRNQMLAVMVLSQHRVSTSKTASPRIPVGARCTGHVRIICSAVCSAAPHSQFDVGARPHFCMND